MGEDYCLQRLGLLRDTITRERATELYREASQQPGSELTGDLETGFTYWTTTLVDGGTLLKLVKRRISRLRNPDAAPGT